MADRVYVSVMFGVMVIIILFTVPSLFRRKCPACKHRNKLDSDVCEKCGSRL